MWLWLAVSLACSATALSRQQPSEPVLETNLAVIQRLIGNISAQLLGSARMSKGERVALRIADDGENWIVRNEIASALKAESILVFQSNDGPSDSLVVLQVSSAEMTVRYADMHREGLFGARRIRRDVAARISCQVIDARTREVRYSGSLADSAADTVPVDDIERIETAGVETTHASLPPENLLDKIVEPFVIIGATGVVIYLLFHVRS